MNFDEAVRIAVSSVQTGTSMSAEAVAVLMDYVEQLEDDLCNEGLERCTLEKEGRWS